MIMIKKVEFIIILPISKLLKWLSLKSIMINSSDHVSLILNDNADGFKRKRLKLRIAIYIRIANWFIAICFDRIPCINLWQNIIFNQLTKTIRYDYTFWCVIQNIIVTIYKKNLNACKQFSNISLATRNFIV